MGSRPRDYRRRRRCWRRRVLERPPPVLARSRRGKGVARERRYSISYKSLSQGCIARDDRHQSPRHRYPSGHDEAGIWRLQLHRSFPCCRSVLSVPPCFAVSKIVDRRRGSRGMRPHGRSSAILPDSPILFPWRGGRRHGLCQLSDGFAYAAFLRLRPHAAAVCPEIIAGATCGSIGHFSASLNQ